MDKKKDTSVEESIIRKKAPDLPESTVVGLAQIWSEVVHQIVQAIFAKDDRDDPLHVNVKAEMNLELAKIISYLTEVVIEKRIGERALDAIDPKTERAACLEGEGLEAIEATATNLYPYWRERMDVRWLPKSRKAMDREANPPKPRPLSVKPVRDKHFISRWFIRDFWSDAGTTTRWRLSGDDWVRKTIPFGRWGHREGLWDDRVEAWFALLEGDGKRPLEMLLAMEPLNPPQRKALVGFLVIHMLRNPSFVLGLRHHLRDMMDKAAADAGMRSEDMARAAYATLFENHGVYQSWAAPIFTSRWAIVSADQPVFVLPDGFCARVAFGDSYRLIVPLTPKKCFVTLGQADDGKSVVPSPLRADHELARRISSLLIDAANSEFISHSGFVLDPIPARPSFSDVLSEIQARIDRPASG